MSDDNKRQNLENTLSSTIKREQTRNYIILYSVTIIILMILLAYSFAKGFFSSEDFIVNIVNNIIGILPPILIFDFFNEKLSRDSSAIEMSNKITETLMSNPETMDLFTEEQKKTFIRSAIASIVRDEDATEMINDNLRNYLMENTDYRIRTEFDYDFELDEKLPAIYNVFRDRSNYFYVQEKLHYRVKYLSEKANNTSSNEVKIGFVFDNQSLDNVLREKKADSDFDNCIFRESLDIREEDINYFRGLASEPAKLREQFQRMFKLDLQIDSFKGEVKEVCVKETGIIVKLYVGHDVQAMEHAVRIIFHMPKRWDSVLEVALVDPTKAPKISVSYPEDMMDVDMFSFLSKGEESSLEVAHEHFNGIYDISINNEWIYPISGMVFSVDRIKGEEEE